MFLERLCETKYRIFWIRHSFSLHLYHTDFPLQLTGSLVFHEVSQPIYETLHRIFDRRHCFGLNSCKTDFVVWLTRYSKGIDIDAGRCTNQQLDLCESNKMPLKTQCVKIWDKYIYVNGLGIRAKSCEISCKYLKHFVSSTCLLSITKITKNDNHKY